MSETIAQSVVPNKPKLYGHSQTKNMQGCMTTIEADFPLEKQATKITGVHPIDILTLQPEERKHLLEGFNTSIIADSNIVIRKAVPLRALTASCTKVHDLFQVRPKATQFRVYGKVNQKSIEKLLDIFTTEKLVDTKDIKLVVPDMSFVDGVLLYQACLALGIVYHHTKPLLNFLCAQVTAHDLSPEEMSTIVNRCPPQDPLFRHLANKLCHRRFKKQIKDVAFEHWLAKKPTLQKAMSDIDQAHEKRRTAINERKCTWSSGNI
ncbi:hypothetical protein T440DRAFT_518644 [Plenodomus tracheiphilus IPT5]|uniref:BTB domain-containing protein n=1 Tax=Plenodomus tracheiphilus IPT5 TaxID=1408161 RepID=A0A6A7B741_9PLEO|nr:hypothetical protein T440DRAFT_518644 [Plenodomus tracheiphilus IPT5]